MRRFIARSSREALRVARVRDSCVSGIKNGSPDTGRNTRGIDNNGITVATSVFQGFIPRR